MDSVLIALAETTTKPLYVTGKKDEEIAKKITELFNQTYKRISNLSGPEQGSQRQFVFSSLVLIQTSQLFNLIGLQEKDIQENSPLRSTFEQLFKILYTLKEIKIDINPDKQLTAILEAALASAANKPVYGTLLKKLSGVLS